jgi:hypothetical protein
VIVLDDDDLPMLVLGAGGALAAVVLVGRTHDRGGDETAGVGPSGDVDAPLDARAWVFPVPDLGGRRPEVSDGWGSPRHDPDGTRRLHLGADIMFRRRTRGELVEVYPPGSANGSPGYFMPDGVPVLASGAGVVTFAAWTARGYTVTVRHPEGWTTYYTHLAALSVVPKQTVAAGQPIGTVGFDPSGHRKLMHLHVELWRGHKRAGATDPAPYLTAWARRAVVGWAAPARNAGLTYRPVGGRGERYPDWLRALKGASGVYVIRERRGNGKPVVVYVGQSNAGRLYETMTRHFQAWRRWKGFWRGQFAEGHDPGLTYEREHADAAVRVTSPADSLDEEARLIARLRPRDNLIGQPEAVPF